MKRTGIRLVFFILGLLYGSLFSLVSAQTTWEKLYYDADNQGADLNETNIDLKYDSLNDQYIFLGLNHSANGGISVYKLSSSGDLLSRNYYYSGGGGGPNLQFLKNGGAIMYEIGVDSGEVITELFKIDTSYDTILWKFEYGIYNTHGVGLKETSDHKFLIAGTTYFGPGGPFLLKIDSSGNLTRSFFYYEMPAYAEFVTECNDGNYLIAANSYQDKGVELFKTDTSGNVLWSKSYFRPNGYIHDIVVKPNGHLVVIGNTDVTTQTPIPAMFISELDTAGNTIWSKIYGDSINSLINFPVSDDPYQPIVMKQTFDGGYIITAGIKVPSHPSIDLVLIKTDSLGNVQWERRHGGYSSYESGINIIQTPDKGFFVVGGANVSTFEQAYYILKTDSLGFTNCSMFSDSIAQRSINPTDSSIVVTDSTIAINVYPGYVYNKTNSAPSVEDGCLIDGLKEISINEDGLLIYPNPTAGKFQLVVSSDDFNVKDILIYDMLGKNVYERKHFTDSTLDFDLSNESKGVYFLNVNSETKRATFKVVVL